MKERPAAPTQTQTTEADGQTLPEEHPTATSFCRSDCYLPATEWYIRQQLVEPSARLDAARAWVLAMETTRATLHGPTSPSSLAYHVR